MLEIYNIKDSTMIKVVAHYANTLFVTFNDGSVYRFDECFVGHASAMAEAESAGKYFNAHIRKAYEGTRVVSRRHS